MQQNRKAGMHMPRRKVLTACLAALVWALPAAAASAQQTSYEFRDGKFVKVAEPDPLSAAGELADVRRALADGDADRAIKLAGKWIDAHDDHPLLPEAYLLRGDAKVLNDDYYKALFDYEHLVRTYPGSAQFMVALEREFEIAKLFAGGKRRKLWGMRILPAKGEAEELLIRVQERSPGSDLAEMAGLALSDHYYQSGQMILAAEAYDIFLDNYPRSEWAEFAMQRRVTANLATFKGPRFDATGLYEADVRLQTFKQRFPAAAEQTGADELIARVDESLASKQFVTAQWYDGQDNRVSAMYMYSRVVTDHPGSAAARRALLRLREMDPVLADQIQARALEQGEPAPDRTDRLIRRTPTADTEPPPPDVEPEAPVMDRPDMVNPEINR